MTEKLRPSYSIEDEAGELAARSAFSREDAAWSLERGLKYFQDCGHDEANSRDLARDFVSSAALLARRLGFGLPEAVEYMIFSCRHRAHSVCEPYLPAGPAPR